MFFFYSYWQQAESQSDLLSNECLFTAEWIGEQINLARTRSFLKVHDLMWISPHVSKNICSMKHINKDNFIVVFLKVESCSYL